MSIQIFSWYSKNKQHALSFKKSGTGEVNVRYLKKDKYGKYIEQAEIPENRITLELTDLSTRAFKSDFSQNSRFDQLEISTKDEVLKSLSSRKITIQKNEENQFSLKIRAS